MPTFQYQAVDPSGSLTTGITDADSELSAIAQLRDRGLMPISVEIGAALAAGLGSRSLFVSKTVGRDQILAMTRDLANLTTAGLPLDRALEVLISLGDTPSQQLLLQSLRDEVRGGASLSQALERRPKLFSKLYSNMVRAGEASGALGMVLTRLTEFQEKARELRQTVTSALTYPSIVLVAAVASIVMMIVVVLPQFEAMFKDSKKALPEVTAMVLNGGQWLRANGWMVPLFAFGAWFLLRAWLKTPRGRYRWDARKLNLPIFGELSQKIEVARFARTLATLLHSGVSLLPALNIVKDTVTNTVLAASLDGVTAKLREGRGLSAPLMETGLYPKLAVHMVKVGEETGRLPEMLTNVADIYDKDVQVTVKRLVTLIEPLLILGLAVVVGGMIVSVLLGIMSVSDLT
jgi:general secretion pathway protein F